MLLTDASRVEKWLVEPSNPLVKVFWRGGEETLGVE
jgi:hypothetical protein